MLIMLLEKAVEAEEWRKHRKEKRRLERIEKSEVWNKVEKKMKKEAIEKKVQDAIDKKKSVELCMMLKKHECLLLDDAADVRLLEEDDLKRRRTLDEWEGIMRMKQVQIENDNVSIAVQATLSAHSRNDKCYQIGD